MESENRALHLGEISPGVRLGLSPQQPDVPLEKELKESHSKCVQWKKWRESMFQMWKGGEHFERESPEWKREGRTILMNFDKE